MHPSAARRYRCVKACTHKRKGHIAVALSSLNGVRRSDHLLRQLALGVLLRHHRQRPAQLFVKIGHDVLDALDHLVAYRARVAQLVAVDDPRDPRLADYRDLRDVELRKHLETEEGLFIAEGEKVVRRAVEAGIEVATASVEAMPVAALFGVAVMLWWPRSPFARVRLLPAPMIAVGAGVGLNELEAKEKKVPYEVAVYGIDDLDRAIADGEAHGFVKVLTAPGKDRILGATIAVPIARIGSCCGTLAGDCTATGSRSCRRIRARTSRSTRTDRSVVTGTGSSRSCRAMRCN